MVEIFMLWRHGLWFELCFPIKDTLKSWSPVPQSMTLFGHSVIADAVSLVKTR